MRILVTKTTFIKGALAKATEVVDVDDETALQVMHAGKAIAAPTEQASTKALQPEKLPELAEKAPEAAEKADKDPEPEVKEAAAETKTAPVATAPKAADNDRTAPEGSTRGD